MIVAQQIYQDGKWTFNSEKNNYNLNNFQLVYVFGSVSILENEIIFKEVRNLYPNADIVTSSTSGEIAGDQILEQSVVVTGIYFEKTATKSVQKNLKNYNSSFELGKELFEELNKEDLAGIFLISDGQLINGSELADGLNNQNNRFVPITGGLAGDYANFNRTVTSLNGIPKEGNVIATGFYGKDLLISHDHYGGWDEFGRERVVTRSDKNVLYEIDGQSALSLYKEYLGTYAKELPLSALMFPLSVNIEDKRGKLVRTILSIDEENNTMTFAGNIPEGSTVRLMKANFEKLINGAYKAAERSTELMNGLKPELSILISCVGRKLVLKQRVAEEIEAAHSALGKETVITGFYSNGELSPIMAGANCELHNQTLTITSFIEL